MGRCILAAITHGVTHVFSVRKMCQSAHYQCESAAMMRSPTENGEVIIFPVSRSEMADMLKWLMSKLANKQLASASERCVNLHIISVKVQP